MRRLSQLILFLGLSVSLFAQSPHGDGLIIDCAACHNTEGWLIPESWRLNTPAKPETSGTTGWVLDDAKKRFSHDQTDYELTGQHLVVDCKNCHTSLVFSEASPECVSCHTDMHNQTVGMDCARCHSPENWLVDNISQLHQDNGFPLVGAHSAVTCAECHTSETALRFDRIGNDCVSCHLPDYEASTNPNHENAGFSKDCAECHDVFRFGWTTELVNHDFFPLTLGHDIADCAACHTSGNFSDTPNECVACHQADFDSSNDPNHPSADFSTDCASCHTTDPGWMPAEFLEHDASFFPIYSGGHLGQWERCSDCHSNSSDYLIFTCVSCHLNPETDEQHDGVIGYVYDDPACLACHPTGNTDDLFDHNTTNFPLTGAHVTTECLECHTNGFAGTPMECAACHTLDFNETTNPDHETLEFPTDCASCHTTDPGWMPATFDIHDNYYPLLGAHAQIANDCVTCHNGDYNNTPNTCAGCHIENYNQTTEPDHQSLQFSTDCASCHTEDAWAPATWDHDGQYFPIYSGAHNGEWDQCVDCHTNPSDYTEFTCITCHTNPETDNVHDGVGGYSYNSPACLACHPTGSADDNFDHNNTNFPLTGSHTTVACIECHASGYAGTPTACAACHTPDFDQTINPDHNTLGLSTDCAMCHTTAPDWMPANFPVHDNYYPLNGAHALIATDCAACHNGDYNNTPNTCVGCHLTDFNQTTDPDHQALQFSTDCATCHSESTWVPSTFDHDGQYFPIFSGKHNGEWDQCSDCHTNPADYSIFTCITCHTNPQTNNQHDGVNGYSYNSPACLACHPTGSSDNIFDHNTTGFQLTGGHTSADCLECHDAGFQNTPSECVACHNPEFAQTANPNHNALGLSTDCASCHTTEPGWNPALFADHNSYYALNGAHAIIANECASCHNGDYNNTPNTCAGCHTDNYNQTTNPDHQAAQFPTDCASCHSENAWVPSTFDHNNTNFPLTGAHTSVDCIDCHTAGYQDTPTDCASCHTTNFDQTTNPDHNALGLSTDCAMCHTTAPDWMPAEFPVHNDYYPLNGAHAQIANDCATCHNGSYNNTPNTCFGCHSADYNQTTNPDHQAAQFPTDCAICHSESAWVPSTFDHNNTNFALTGAHTSVDCIDCHTAGYQDTPTDCASCHTTNFDQTTNPDHNALGLPTDCAMCHTTAPDWMPATFPVHDDYYPLNGAHAQIANDCATCHNGSYNNTPNTCFGCHSADYNQTTDPDHQAAQFPTDCAGCHSESAWVPATWDHDGQYFPIYSGSHNGEWDQCVDCHTNPSNYAEFTCTTCHTNPETDNAHNGVGGYSYNSPACFACHPTGSANDNFDHNNTNFPLTGAHTTADCIECHASGYQGTPTDCYACHTDDHGMSLNPSHVALGIPTDCATCHTTDPGWAPASFPIHDDYYPLTGAHVPVANDCAGCHNGDYNNTPNTCLSCHSADYSQSTNPNHPALGIPSDCEMCHTTAPDWMPASFPIHDNYYVLNGAHAVIAQDCAACHNGEYNNTPNTCVGCHINDYTQTTNPNHQAAQFPTDCATCHTESTWVPSTFDHNNFYPIIGAHIPIANDCNACHNGNYNNTPNTCSGCHLNDYNQTTDPDHQAAQFPTDCENCHTQNAWVPSTFDHAVYYPFTGAHIPIANDCNACHNGNYNNTPNTCAGCHTPDYAQSTNPNHPALGIPTDCAMCHTTTPDWTPATFPIHNTYYPLNGAHAVIAEDCAACHNGNYNNTPNTCVGCHLTDYNQTTNPDHQAAQFPTDCESCHSESAWVPSTFNHNQYFPFTGAHIPIANDCNACHNGNYNNTPNTCNGCHTADYAQSTNPNHQALSLPTDCAMCHTTAPDWMPATFPIHNNYYQLNGAHAIIASDCAACHNGNYNNTPNTCYGCHINDYTQTTNPNHQAAQFPINCQDCHTEVAWVPSTFDHDLYYPFTGAHIPIANNCNACHNGNYNNTPNTCAGCHTPDYVRAPIPITRH
ncbi:MAG: hypothetical protein IPJ40_06675 [Saprospirales bacterium]|nr:hypothetical protein [Saprospirales bacterium]